MQHVTECHVEAVTRHVSESERRRARTVHLAVAGMGCVNCANRVRNALLETRGVLDVDVDHIAGLATVWCRGTEAPTAKLTEAVAECGRRSHHRYLAVLLRSRD